MFVCLFEAVHTNPGYGMATLIYNNLLNLISGTVILLISSFIEDSSSGLIILKVINDIHLPEVANNYYYTIQDI